MAKRRVTTHSKVASARARVCVCACTQACVPRHPSSEHSYVGCQGCVFCFVFLFRREPSPVLRKCCRKRWELTPGSASVPLKKGPGLSGRSGEEREGKEEEGRWGGGGLLSAWVCHGHVGGCLHTHADSSKHTDVAAVTTIPVRTRLPARSQ